jgi:hypothetical protein
VYGYAIDYRGTDPVMYLVVRDNAGAMVVSNPVTIPNFNGADVMPMLYGHPMSNVSPMAAVNLGAQAFHYDLAAVRAGMVARGANLTNFVPGVGIHRWP